MIFFKKYYIDTTDGIDCIPLTHEVHYAIRDAGAPSGLATVVLPEPGAGMLVGENLPEVIDTLREIITQWGVVAEGVEATDAKREAYALTERVQALRTQRAISLPFDEGKLCLNAYSDLLLCDFVAKRGRREIRVQILGEHSQDDQQQEMP